MKEEIFLQQETLADLFTLVYVLVDDYLKALEKENICILPKAENQVGSYSELMTIALVGELLKEPYIGQWYEFVKVEYKHLFPKLPDTSRFYRIMNKLERIFADFALRFAPLSHAENYVIDSKALKHCHHKRVKRARQMSEADFGYSSMGMFYGFKLHGIVSEQGVFCRFLIAPANVSDQEAAASLEANAFVLGEWYICTCTAQEKLQAQGLMDAGAFMG